FDSLASPRDANTDRRRLETILARDATWVTAGCSADVEALSRVRRNRARVSLVPGGIDADRFEDSHGVDVVELGCRVACLAPNAVLLDDVSRVLTVLPALGGCRLVVGATGPADDAAGQDWKALQQLAVDLGVAHRVSFLGHLHPDEVATTMQSVDVLVCTPTASPDTPAVLAAMAGGVAVVAYDVGTLSDVVIHDVTGLLVPRNDSRALTKALKALQCERFRRDGMASAGRTRARSRYSWERIAVDAESAYRQVARTPI
ncbi:glycosyl transferase family 1, partial [Mycobacterium sp. ITM-2017-0098]